MLSRLVDEVRGKMSKEEIEGYQRKAKEQEGLRPAEKWQVESFLEQLRRYGVSDTQLAASELCCIHNNEETPQRYLFKEGAGN
jgi:hypothetical protein